MFERKRFKLPFKLSSARYFWGRFDVFAGM